MADNEHERHLKAGVKAFKAGNYVQALPLLKQCATQGSLSARRLLSRMYYAGNGVAEDRTEYYYWLLRAAESGDLAAKSKIKRRYRAGELPDEIQTDPYLMQLVGQKPVKGNS